MSGYEVFDVLGCYVAYVVFLIRRFWVAYQLHLHRKSSSRRILLEILGGFLDTSANNYQHTLFNNAKEQGPRLHRGRSLKSTLTKDFILHPLTDGGSSADKVLCYKSEGRWFVLS